MALADDILTSLDDKMAQQAELRQKLRASLTIADLIPGAFDHGTVKVGARATLRDPHKGVITFRLGNGTVVEKPAMEVPYSLWPQGLKDDLDSMRDHHTMVAVKRKLGLMPQPKRRPR